MSPEKQRIAIAEACGIKWKLEPIYADDEEGPHWYRIEYPNGTEQCGYSLELALPDYLGDLNAMHEAEKVLTDEQHGTFRSTLALIVTGRRDTGVRLMSAIEYRAWFSATAAQKSEALLRTLNLWRDDL